MTTQQAERICGYRIQELAVCPRFGYAAYDDAGAKVAEAIGYTPSEALKRLVEKVYKIHSEIVLKKQNYRCASCGAAGMRLEIDHIIQRSKGRDDRVTNLRGLCASFTGCRVHMRKHNGFSPGRGDTVDISAQKR